MSDGIARALAAIQASQPNLQKTEQSTTLKPNTAPQRVEPPVPTRPTADVLKDATAVAADIKAALATLPAEDTIATQAERNRVWEQRRVLQGLLTSITAPLESRVPKLERRIAERKHWQATLTAARLDLEKSLAAVEAAGSNGDFRLDQALRVSLRMIQNGDDGDEVFAGPLMGWLHKNGIRPEPGARSYLTGRGGLLSTAVVLAELEKEREEIITRVETSLVEARELLAGLPATTTV